METNKEVEPSVGSEVTCLRAVLRSKGFVWMSSSHTTAYYWSHAGSHFELRDEGEWWASVPDAEWPEDSRSADMIVGDFAGKYGDRRQEIVFIGRGIDRQAISERLDSALLSDEEMDKYHKNWAGTKDPAHALVEAVAIQQK